MLLTVRLEIPTIEIRVIQSSEGELKALITQLATDLFNFKETLMATLQQVQDDMSEETTLIESLSSFIAGLQQQIKDALAGTTLPPAVQAQIDAVFTQAEANKAALTQALAANTPAAPVTP